MKDRYIEGLALGLLLGFAISTGSLWLIDSTRGVVSEFFADHLTHFFTLTAAGFALWGVSRQIQGNVELAEHRRKAKLDAARSSLPIVLSNIHEMCEARVYAISFGNKTQPIDKRWEISDFELSTLRSCIEHADGVEKELMQQIIRVYQVLISRWRDQKFVNLFTAGNLCKDDYRLMERQSQFFAIMHWTALSAIADSLFDYARGEQSNPNKNQMRNSVFSSMDRIHSGGLDSNSGLSLTNNLNFSDFLERRIQEDHVGFIDDDWRNKY